MEHEPEELIPSVSPDDLRLALRQIATGVTIVTAEHDGGLFGITATSFTAVSLEPPIVMVSINNASPLSGAIVGASHFAVHLLAADQRPLAERFALPHRSDRFDGLEVARELSGAPVLVGGLASIDCVLARTLKIGTHTVMFGRAVSVNASTDRGDPLLYYFRGYRRLGAPDSESP